MSNSVCSLPIGVRYVFPGTPLFANNGSVYVPASLVDAYKADSMWSELASKIFPIE